MVNRWRAFPLVLALVLGLLGTPAAAAAQEEPPDGELSLPECPEFAGEPAADDELTAYGYARACGVEVEVLGLRDIDRRVFAKPNGLLDARIAVEPQWVRDDAGAWVDIDTTLVGRADGSAATAATVIDVEIGAGGDAPFVTATDPDAGSVALSWPAGALPAPVLDGPVATYPDVLPDVDLAVQAESVGFSWVLVVKSAEAAADPALADLEIGVEAEGLTVTENPESGGIVVTDAEDRVVFEAGQAVMWDSSGPDGTAEPNSAPANEPKNKSEKTHADPGKVAEVGVELTDSGLELTPDPAMLADRSVTYPLYIDPPFTSTRKAWANVFKGDPNRGWTGDSNWPRAGGMRVGLNTWSDCGDGCGLWRSVITLNIGGLNSRHIHSAHVKMLQTHLGGCSARNLELWRINAISNGVSWNGVNWLYGAPLQSRSVPSSNTTGGCGSGNSDEWVDFGNSNVKTRVQSAADQRYDTISFGVRSSSEGTREAWRRIRTSSVALHVEYYIYPPLPDTLKLNGTGCRTSLSSAPWITSSNPTMSARARSYESEPVYLRMRVRRTGSDTNLYYYRTPSTVASHAIVNHRITATVPDGEYLWQARTDSRQTTAVNSGYTGPCYFKVDATNPGKVSVTAPQGPLRAGQDLVFGISASDPVVNGFHSGLNRYEFSWNTPTFDQSVTPNGSTSITLPEVPAGRYVLYVRSVDNAGNESEATTRTFFVGSDIPATAMGMWRFEGDTFDDTPHDGIDLNRVTGAATVFGPDRDGRADATITLDGQTCHATDDPVVDTSASFSVAAWVRLDSADGYIKALAHTDGSRSAMQIQYNSAEGKWYLSMPSAQTGDFSWRGVGARATAGLGEWQHVAATFDADARIMRLYLDGQLAGEMTSGFEPWNADQRLYVGCTGGDGGTSNHLHGAMDQVGLWQGLLTPAQIQAAMTDLPAATELAHWDFRNGGTDSSRFGRDLAIPAHVEVGEDSYGRPHGAIELDGQTCLEHPESFVDTDRSFSVGTWVRTDSITQGVGAIVSTFTADSYDGFELWASPWSRDDADLHFGIQKFPGNFGRAHYGKWHHVAFAYDAPSRTVTTYLDGRAAGTSTARDTQVSNNPLLIGCSYYAGEERVFHFDGALHDLRLWRGAVSAADIASMVGDPPVELMGRYRLDGSGGDTSGKAHDLVFASPPTYNDGWSCDPDGALELTGAGTAETAGPVVDTDESFTVSAWVRLDSLDAHAPIVTAAGQHNTSFRLEYSGSGKRFEFMLLTQDLPAGEGGETLIAHGGPTPALNTWYHLVGVYDLRRNQVRLYVSGTLEGSRAGPAHPWNSTGPLVIGAAGKADGDRWNLMDGAVDDIVVWQGALPDAVIGRISAAPVKADQC